MEGGIGLEYISWWELRGHSGWGSSSHSSLLGLAWKSQMKIQLVHDLIFLWGKIVWRQDYGFQCTDWALRVFIDIRFYGSEEFIFILLSAMWGKHGGKWNPPGAHDFVEHCNIIVMSRYEPHGSSDQLACRLIGVPVPESVAQVPEPGAQEIWGRDGSLENFSLQHCPLGRSWASTGAPAQLGVSLSPHDCASAGRAD